MEPNVDRFILHSMISKVSLQFLLNDVMDVALNSFTFINIAQPQPSSGIETSK